MCKFFALKIKSMTMFMHANDMCALFMGNRSNLLVVSHSEV